MIICAVDTEKDKELLKGYFAKSSQDYVFSDSIQDCIHQIFLNKSIDYIVIDTEKEPKISSARLGVFVKNKKIPCVILTNSVPLSAKLKHDLKGNSFVSVILYGDQYPDLSKAIPFKKKKFRSNTEKIKKEEKDLGESAQFFFKVMNYTAVVLLSAVLVYTFYQLVFEQVKIKFGKEHLVYSWFILGFFGIISRLYVIKDYDKKRYSALIFFLCSLIGSYLKLYFFLPMLVVSGFFVLELVFRRKFDELGQRKLRERKEFRYPVDGYVQVIPSTSSENFTARIVDMSLSGVLIESRGIIVEGEEIKIHNENFSVFAEVKRSFKQGEMFRAGVEFQFLTRDAKESIQQFITLNKLDLTP